jgi:biopolymer transport protein ExbB
VGLLRIGGLIVALLVVVMLFTTTGAMAQDVGGEAVQGSASRLFDHFVTSGGIITWLVLIPMSIATIALFVEHSVSIRRRNIVPVAAVQRIQADLDAKRYVDAVRFAADDPSVFALAMSAALAQAKSGYAAMQRAMFDVVDQSAGRMMRRIEYLNVIGNVSPMVGLFGTVVGMIRLFASINEAGGIPEPAIIASDISVALVTTFWGLLVAIPALSVFAFFRNRIDGLTTECAIAGEQLLRAFDPTAGGSSPPISDPESQLVASK